MIQGAEMKLVWGRTLPDWKVWKLCAGDFKNSIVNI